MELNSPNNCTDNQTGNRNTVYQVKRSAAIRLGIFLVLLIIVCFVANIIALNVYFGRSKSLFQNSSAQTQDQIRNMDIHKSEVNFTFEIADVQELFDRRDENWGSEFFYCRSIPFYVNLKYARGGNDYLSAGLVLYNPMDTYTYHMSGVYELRLVNWQGKGDFIRKYEYVFDESGKVFGPRFFISATDLLHEPSDWIKDKKIKLKVNLTCGNLYRTYSSK